MADINEVVQNLRNIKTYLQGQAIEASAAREALIESQKCIDDALELLKEQKHGQWTTHRTQQHHGEWYCDQCGYEPTVFEATPYCPNCGAIMF